MWLATVTRIHATMGHVLKDLTELTTVSAIQGTVDLIVKVLSNSSNSGEKILTEEGTFKKINSKQFWKV